MVRRIDSQPLAKFCKISNLGGLNGDLQRGASRRYVSVRFRASADRAKDFASKVEIAGGNLRPDQTRPEPVRFPARSPAPSRIPPPPPLRVLR